MGHLAWTAGKLITFLLAWAAVGAYFGYHWKDDRASLAVRLLRRPNEGLNRLCERPWGTVAVGALMLLAFFALMAAPTIPSVGWILGFLGPKTIEGKAKLLVVAASAVAMGATLGRDEARTKKVLDKAKKDYIRRVKAGEIEEMENPPEDWKIPED